MISINGTNVSAGFSGLINLGDTDRLYISGDGEDYELYGTVFRLDEESVIIPPSEAEILSKGELESFLERLLLERLDVATELGRISDVRSSVLQGRYDYGVSKDLMENLEFVSYNTIHPTPSVLIGGNLGYDSLEKNNDVAEPFEDTWVNWSHVGAGLKKYDSVHTRTAGRILEVSDLSVANLKRRSTSGSESQIIPITS